MTYASGSIDITKEILSSYSLECRECHTITWRESKYTLIYLTKRIRCTVLHSVMQKMREDHNIIGSAIQGYDTFAGTVKNDQDISMEEHPGFKRMIQLLNENYEEIRSWMELGTIKTNKHGILWRYITTLNPRSMTRSQLVQNTEKLSVLTEEHTTMKKEHEALLSAYAAQSNELKMAMVQNDDLFKQLCEKISEVGSLKRQLNRRRLVSGNRSVGAGTI
jgi:hypothetical protein